MYDITSIYSKYYMDMPATQVWKGRRKSVYHLGVCNNVAWVGYSSIWAGGCQVFYMLPSYRSIVTQCLSSLVTLTRYHTAYTLSPESPLSYAKHSLVTAQQPPVRRVPPGLSPDNRPVFFFFVRSKGSQRKERENKNVLTHDTQNNSLKSDIMAPVIFIVPGLWEGSKVFL